MDDDWVIIGRPSEPYRRIAELEAILPDVREALKYARWDQEHESFSTERTDDAIAAIDRVLGESHDRNS